MIKKNTNVIYSSLNRGCFRFLTKEQCICLVLLVLFIVVVTIVSLSFSRDSANYNRMFLMYGASSWDSITAEVRQRELFFMIVSKIVFKLDLHSFFLFFIYASISLSVKFWLICGHSKDKWLSLAFFISYFLLLHDATQIRFGLAIGFVYFGLHFLAENKRLLFSVIVIFSAIMFHVVSSVFIFMLFFTSKKSLFWLLGMVALAVVLYVVNLNEIMLSVVGDVINFFDFKWTVFNRLYSYLQKPSSDIFLGIFSRSAMLVYLCAIVIFQYRDKFSTYELLCYNAFILSIFFYILLKDSVDFQVRIRDLFGFSLVFLMPFIHRGMSVYIGNRNAYIILYLYLGVHLVKFAIYDKMLII